MEKKRVLIVARSDGKELFRLASHDHSIRTMEIHFSFGMDLLFDGEVYNTDTLRLTTFTVPKDEIVFRRPVAEEASMKDPAPAEPTLNTDGLLASTDLPLRQGEPTLNCPWPGDRVEHRIIRDKDRG